MTLQQLEYLLAVHQHRNFLKAAEACFVTQPTLSMQIQKLEDEFEIKIFDRSKQPVTPTAAGQEIIEYARNVLHAAHELSSLVESQKGKMKGILKIGIIPTLAPYLLPLFVPAFTRNYPNVKLLVQEQTTDVIIRMLKEGSIDAGLLVTPINDSAIKEHVLFYEELMVYASKNNRLYDKQYLLQKDIDVSKLWLLEESHCFRSQILSLCELQKQSREFINFEYEAGSIETLKRMVDVNDGITIIPQLATLQMQKNELRSVRNFKSPVPVREVSLIVHGNFIKKRLIDSLKKEILAAIPEDLSKNKKKHVLPVQ
ncbi:LysR substrate-binding domain-containing protein [Niabella insulamsoli]|uniref:hydrogen peroxide-inducible genes activator n=1 Tax=Niabella insulamsoli TaxID=3144874 RepID=UPI0031FC8B3E